MWAFFKLQNYFPEHPSLLARIQVGGKINGVNYVSRKWVILYMLFKNEFNFNCVWKSDTELKELGSVEYQLPYRQGPLLRTRWKWGRWAPPSPCFCRLSSFLTDFPGWWHRRPAALIPTIVSPGLGGREPVFRAGLLRCVHVP